MSLTDVIYQAREGSAVTAEGFALLVDGVKNPSTAPIVRVRAVEHVGKQAGKFESEAVKALAALVDIIAAAELSTDNQTLLTSAVQAIVDLCASCSTKRFEVTREAADVLAQVSLSGSGFPEPIRLAARKAFDALLSVDFRAVLMKMLHWLSDEREGDTSEQLFAERGFALSTLGRLARSAGRTGQTGGKTDPLAEQWTESVQDDFLKFAAVVLNCCTASQFKTLVGICAALPTAKEDNGSRLSSVAGVDSASGPSVRNADIIRELSHYATGRRTNDALIAAALAPLSSDLAPAVSVAYAKAAAAAARVTSPGASASHLPSISAAVQRTSVAAQGSTPVFAEALLQTFATLAKRSVLPPASQSDDNGAATTAEVSLTKPQEQRNGFAAAIGGDDGLVAALAAQRKAAQTECLLLRAAVDKAVGAGSATPAHGEALRSLENISAIADALIMKTPQNFQKPSWVGPSPLPGKQQPPALKTQTSHQAKDAKRGRDSNQGRKRAASQQKGNGKPRRK